MADELVEEIIDEAVESADEQIVGQYPEIAVHYKEASP